MDEFVNVLEWEKTKLYSQHPEWTLAEQEEAWHRHKHQMMAVLSQDSTTSIVSSMPRVATDGDHFTYTADSSSTATINPVDTARCANMVRQRSNKNPGSRRPSNNLLPAVQSFTTGRDELASPVLLGEASSREQSASTILDHSCSTSFSSLIPPSSSTLYVLRDPSPSDIVAYSPEDFVSRYPGQHEPTHVSAFSTRRSSGQPSLSSSRFARRVSTQERYAHAAQSVGMTPSSSRSTYRTLHSTLPSVLMSRESSQTSASGASQLYKTMDMLRVASSSSYPSNGQVLEPGDHAIFPEPSCSDTDQSSSSDATATVNTNENEASLLEHVGLGLYSQDLPSFMTNCDPNFLVNSKSQQNAAASPLPLPTESEPMDRTISQSSTSSTESKHSERLRKHIANADKQPTLKPKNPPSAPIPAGTSAATAKVTKSKRLTAAARAAHTLSLQRGPTSARRIPRLQTNHSEPKRLQCNKCDEHPGGFHGEHELRRHREHRHSPRRRVWIVAYPSLHANLSSPPPPPLPPSSSSSSANPSFSSSSSTDPSTRFQPSFPLAQCKSCTQRKWYAQDYNASAHLRRMHFAPRPRGRCPRGEVRESRAGKGGGNWPPIDWLKDNGWLCAVDIDANGREVGAPAQAAVTVPAVEEDDGGEDVEEMGQECLDGDVEEMMEDWADVEEGVGDGMFDAAYSRNLLGLASAGSDMPTDDDFLEGLGLDYSLQYQDSFDSGNGSWDSAMAMMPVDSVMAPSMEHATSAPPYFHTDLL